MPIPPLQSVKQSDHVASMLYVADFLNQFTKVLAIKPTTFEELASYLHPTIPPDTLLEPAALRATAGAASGSTGGARSTAVGASGKVHAATVVPNGTAVAVPNGAVPGSGPSSSSNGTAANGADEGASAGNEGLFELYRGLLQFLLQVRVLVFSMLGETVDDVCHHCCHCLS